MSDRPRLRPPLIGREEQLERMMAKLAFALSGKGTVVLVSGEAGCGKTRLVEEFQNLASNTRCACVSATCTAGQLPYQPFRAAMADLSRVDPQIADSSSFQEFCRCRDVGASGKRELEGEERALFSAQELIREASGRLPLVIRIDDLQMADAKTIQMLHFLARGLVSTRAVIACTYSDDELYDRQGRPHPLIEATRIMKREGLCEDIPLAPLTEGQLAEALGGLIEKELDEQALGSLYHESGGNPQIAVELTLEALRSGAMMLGRDKATMESWHDLGIPPGLRAWVGRKLDALPGDQLQLLQCASLLGDRFDAELLASALGKQKLETLELLDDAVREYRLYLEDGERYMFRWGVVRRVASECIPSARAMELRRSIDMARVRRGRPS